MRSSNRRRGAAFGQPLPRIDFVENSALVRAWPHATASLPDDKAERTAILGALGGSALGRSRQPECRHFASRRTTARER